MKFKNILLEFDDTIVDFYDAEEKAFFKIAEYYHHYASKEDFAHFRKVNQEHWEAFQKNELTKGSFITSLY